MYSAEYTYNEEEHHLTENGALEAYKKARTEHPGAIVVLDDLNCGHWDVDIYETPEQKEAFYKREVVKLLRYWRSKVIQK